MNNIINKDHSVGLEHDEYAHNIDLVIQDAIKAVANTGVGYYVNVVTPDTFGNPMHYLTSILDEHFQDSIRYQYIDQCGCGGYVLRVWKLSPIKERCLLADKS